MIEDGEVLGQGVEELPQVINLAAGVAAEVEESFADGARCTPFLGFRVGWGEVSGMVSSTASRVSREVLDLGQNPACIVPPLHNGGARQWREALAAPRAGDSMEGGDSHHCRGAFPTES